LLFTNQPNPVLGGRPREKKQSVSFDGSQERGKSQPWLFRQLSEEDAEMAFWVGKVDDYQAPISGNRGIA
jgi:hypothetical protein